MPPHPPTHALQGDTSAAQAAMLAGLGAGAASAPGGGMMSRAAAGMHIDEALRAENGFLGACDFAQVWQGGGGCLRGGLVLPSLSTEPAPPPWDFAHG